jgi:ferredoxin
MPDPKPTEQKPLHFHEVAVCPRCHAIYCETCHTELFNEPGRTENPTDP